MKICAACTLELPKETFSNEQWQLKLPQRRCTECISVERFPQLTAPSCWICLDDEADKQERLRRDCSCRGPNAGFVHLSCLVEYSEKKNIACRDVNKLGEPWIECPNCKQNYQNVVSIDMANEFVSFVQREHPNDKHKLVVALEAKLVSLFPTQLDEAKEVATRLLELIGKMKVEMPMLPRRYMEAEAVTYHTLGGIAFGVKTEDGDREALDYFNKFLELSTANNFADGIVEKKHYISVVKSRLEGEHVKQNKEERVTIRHDLYELYVTTYGEEDALTIDTGVFLAIALRDAHHDIEAMRLLTRLVTVSERFHGPHQICKIAAQKSCHALKST